MGCVLTTLDELSIEQHLALDASRLALAASGIRCCGVELLAVDAPLSACRRWASTGAAELVPAAYGIRCRRVVHAATSGTRSSAVGMAATSIRCCSECAAGWSALAFDALWFEAFPGCSAAEWLRSRLCCVA